MPETIDNMVPRIGAFVLETLTTGMYTNALDTLREYIQNSFDAVQEAERIKLLSPGAGRIEINIDEKNRSIKIRDNGIGISEDQAYTRLVNIGMSDKSIQTNAGFRGIGRLAGIAYCDKLLFRTQAEDKPSITTIEFDNSNLREAMSPQMRQVKELSEVIADNASVHIEKVRKKTHFFEVCMEGVSETGQIFLDWQRLNHYLCQVAPVGLDTQSFHLSSVILKWLREHQITIPSVSLTISSGPINRQVFKPYQKLTYSTEKSHYKVHLKDIHFFPKDAGPESPFWGWYADTNCPGTIGDVTVAGFRVRKANIGVGMTDLMTELFRESSESYARLNKYFIGEIHIQDPNVIPNARRDGFEETQEWRAIREHLISFAHERSREVYSLSTARNMDIERLVSGAEKERIAAEDIQKTGLASKDEKKKILDRIDKQVEKLNAADKSERSEEERKQINDVRELLKRTRDSIDGETEYTVKKLNTALDKKQRKIIKEIIKLLYETLEEKGFEKAKAAILKKFGIQEEENGK